MPLVQGQRRRRWRQTTFDEALTRGRSAHCLGCGQPLPESGACEACGAFPCRRCGCHTTENGGDGETCYACLSAPLRAT